MDRTWLRAGLLPSVCAAVSLLVQTPLSARPGVRLVVEEKKAEAASAPAGPGILPSDYGGTLPPAVGVTLADVLRLTSLNNLDLVQADLVINRARIAVTRARAQYLPTVTASNTYVNHQGEIQNTAGNVQAVNRDSLFNGLGSGLAVDVSSALFQPAEARALLEAARFGRLRVTNDTLQRVADAYLEVLRARRRLAALDETLGFLASEEISALRGDSRGLLPLIRAFVQNGTRPPADQARVEADVVRYTESRVRALQDVRVASAELARLLHLGALAFLLPADDYRSPLLIPGEPWLGQPAEVLVIQALHGRPELAENSAVMDAAAVRRRLASWRYVLPQVVVNYSWGGFGGGPAVIRRTSSGSTVLGESGVIDNYAPRQDFDVSLVWRLQNLGVGNAAEKRDATVGLEQARIRQLQLIDLVTAQTMQAYEQLQRSKQRLEVTRTGLFDGDNKPTGAVYRSIRLNFIRIKGGEGVPLEVLDSIRRLGDVLDGYANALTDYDRARFRVLTALGMPPAAFLDPQLMPAPPPPAPLCPQPGPEGSAPGPQLLEPGAGPTPAPSLPAD